MILIGDSDNAFIEFKYKVEQLINEDLSEADTRSKVIDTLFINILGWDEDDIQREGHGESGYFDYKISIPGINFIVEAKRQFTQLSIPTNHRQASIKSIYKENKEVIDQIRGYAMDAGIPYGVITNGRQFILLKLINTDGKPWKDNQCLLFDGIEEVDARFMEFYDNLSKYSVSHNGGFKFDFPLDDHPSNSIISTLIDKDKELIRNSLSASITPIIDGIFGEIFSEEKEDDVEFIKKCFVENKETKKNRDEIERLFADRAPHLAEVIPAVHYDSLKKQIGIDLNGDDISIKNTAPPKPIVVIGSKGSGKTTFINHLFKYNLPAEDAKKHMVIYLDFRKFYNQELFFEPSKVAFEILEIIYSKFPHLNLNTLDVLKRIYLKDIKRNDEGIWLYDKKNNDASYNAKLSSFLEESQKNNLKHLENLSHYLIRERRNRLIIIIDNADQFDSVIQEKVFVFSHSLTKTAMCGSVIALREGYYYKWRFSPPFDAYENNVYHITAPNYVDVLQKRIDFTLEKLQIAGKVSGKTEKGYSVEIDNDSVRAFLASVRDSLFSESNTDIINYLNCTTYPNIREGLRVFKLFLTSGHTKVTDYILREKYRSKEENRQIIPMHEFVKSVGLLNKHYYNSQISIVYNLFIPPKDSSDHFIKIYLLKELYLTAEREGIAGKYVSYDDIIQKFSDYGYRSNVILEALLSLIKFGLLDSDEIMTDTEWQNLPNNFNCCITLKGYYYYKELIIRFHYFDLVLQDTPIFDKNLFGELKTLFPLSDQDGKRSINKRVETVKKFIEYLTIREDLQGSKVQTIYGKVVDTISVGLKKDLQKLKNV